MLLGQRFQDLQRGQRGVGAAPCGAEYEAGARMTRYRLQYLERLLGGQCGVFLQQLRRMMERDFNRSQWLGSAAQCDILCIPLVV
jgi:hypothetical protein